MRGRRRFAQEDIDGVKITIHGATRLYKNSRRGRKVIRLDLARALEEPGLLRTLEGEDLIVSGIDQFHYEEASNNGAFARNWGIVKDWSEASRYDPAITETEALAFFLAVTDPTDGVLAWLKKQW